MAGSMIDAVTRLVINLAPDGLADIDLAAVRPRNLVAVGITKEPAGSPGSVARRDLGPDLDPAIEEAELAAGRQAG